MSARDTPVFSFIISLMRKTIERGRDFCTTRYQEEKSQSRCQSENETNRLSRKLYGHQRNTTTGTYEGPFCHVHHRNDCMRPFDVMRLLKPIPPTLAAELE